jgi:hypothetical protein
MSTPLEKLIGEAARSGRLAGLTLWPSGARWQASTTEDRIGWNVATDDDPVEALRRVLSGTTTDTKDEKDIFS